MSVFQVSHFLYFLAHNDFLYAQDKIQPHLTPNLFFFFKIKPIFKILTGQVSLIWFLEKTTPPIRKINGAIY